MMLKSVFIKLLIFSVAIAALVAIAGLLLPAVIPFQSFTWISLLFFFLLTALSLYIGIRGLDKTGYGFVASINGIVLLKLMLSVVLVLIYVLAARPKDPKFIIPFFLFYILFTVFEVREWMIVQKMKAKNKQ